MKVPRTDEPYPPHEDAVESDTEEALHPKLWESTAARVYNMEALVINIGRLGT